MSQVSSAQEQPNKHEGIQLPIDGLIRFVARNVGGDKSREVERFLKFGFVGTLGAIIDLGTSFTLLNTVFDPVVQMQFLTAATISFTIAVLSNFFWNRYWTYPDSRTRPIQEQLFLFAIVSITGWVGRTIWLTFMEPIFSRFAESQFPEWGIPVTESQAALIGGMSAIFIGIFVVMIWNFFVNRYWTFNDVE